MDSSRDSAESPIALMFRMYVASVFAFSASRCDPITWYAQLQAVNARVCADACRGQLRPPTDGHVGEFATELDEMRCTLAGHKPLTLLHRFFPEARLLAEDCRAGVLTPNHESLRGIPRLVTSSTDGPSQARDRAALHDVSGPTLIYVRGKQNRAFAAVEPLRAIGAWCQDNEGEASATGFRLTAMQGHLCLGALLGYPERDLKAMHMMLCDSQGERSRGRVASRPATAKPLPCDYARDAGHVRRYLDAWGIRLEE